MSETGESFEQPGEAVAAPANIPGAGAGPPAADASSPPVSATYGQDSESAPPDVDPSDAVVPPYGQAAEPAPSSRRTTRLAVTWVAAGVVAVGAYFGVTAFLHRDTIVIPATLGGMAQSTDTTVKVVASGIQAQMQSAAGAQGHSQVMGYGDVNKFALLLIVQGDSSAGAPTSDQMLQQVITSANGQSLGGGTTVSFSPPAANGDATCTIESATNASTSKQVGTMCVRIVSNMGYMVMAVPPDGPGTVSMIDTVVAAQ